MNSGARWQKPGVVRGQEYQVYRKDGSTFWVAVNARAVRDETGAISYYEGFIQDITERKQSNVNGEGRPGDFYRKGIPAAPSPSNSPATAPVRDWGESFGGRVRCPYRKALTPSRQ